MDFLNFADISFLPNSSIGYLRVHLNNIVGQGVWADTFQLQNSGYGSWMIFLRTWTVINCVVIWFSQIYAAGILNSAKEIHFYVLCSEKLIYADYVEKCISGNVCTFKLLTEYNLS
jgi:hypothetical protein